MKIKWLFVLFIPLLICLTSCSGNLDKSSLPEQTVTRESLNPGIDLCQGSESSKLTNTRWDDREIFQSSLSPAGQQYLNTLPGASVYHISVNIPDDISNPILGWVEVRYTNKEDFPLEEIYFRLFPNFHGGHLTVKDIEISGHPMKAHLESDNTALRVDLAKPLSPGVALNIKMEFELHLPTEMSGNYGLLGYFDEILVLDTFYPMIPAYDDSGWYAHYPYQNGDHTNNDASFYMVEVTAPTDLVIASSGSVVEKCDQDGKQHLWIASGPARDFFLAGSTKFTMKSKVVDDIIVNSYALEGFSEIQNLAMIYAGQALQTFNQLFGEYPYQEFDVISSPMQALGIEYPGITGIFLGLYEKDGESYGLSNQILIESVIAHEVGHQWFYNLIGNDQQSEPWVDESITQYITYLYYEEQYGKGSGAGLIQNWEGRWQRIDKEQIPIGLSADQYGKTAYSPIVYGRGPLFYLELEQQIGYEPLLGGINQYIQKNLWQVTDTEDIKQSLESSCACDLEGVFEEWIYSIE